ncbi:Serine protease 41 [Hondaea fermentalgiana]|uniref:Serine protease 41 n=1 Tax=Hondaea fermentalgiana TaxID=2315210 RepID=A0A2R5GW36_9STRA|nr:Serine protease 41 [Hondaea fermentalgiana]|eukprot:GBG32883.1 Serine protease 41 [Hondaea fermentalgiana]
MARLAAALYAAVAVACAYGAEAREGIADGAADGEAAARRELLFDDYAVSSIPMFVGSVQAKVSGDWLHMCTGAFIDRGWVLTSAECMNFYSAIPNMRFVLNQKWLASDGKWAKSVLLLTADREERDGLVLLPLSNKINQDRFTPMTVSPSVGGYYENVGSSVYVTSWFEPDSDEPSDLASLSPMSTLDLTVRSDSVCDASFSGSLNWTENFCASAEESVADDSETCFGDLGSPIYQYDSDGNGVLIGVLQERTGCTVESYMAKLTRATLHMSWMEDVVGRSLAASVPPTPAPTQRPTMSPTPKPTPKPTTRAPTDAPTMAPTPQPTTAEPTAFPTTAAPTLAPTTARPTLAPTNFPTHAPTNETMSPTSYPTVVSLEPTYAPSMAPPEVGDAASTPPDDSDEDSTILVPIVAGAGGIVGFGAALTALIMVRRRRRNPRPEFEPRAVLQLSPSSMYYDGGDGSGGSGSGSGAMEARRYNGSRFSSLDSVDSSGAHSGGSATQENPMFRTEDPVQLAAAAPPPSRARRILSKRFIPADISKIV